jgi:pimeloyl-ACP methyl ester carboxylesterase
LWTPDKDRAELEALYLQSPADMVDVGGQRLHLRDSGPKDAPAVILLHGFGASLQTWDAWAAGLQASHRVIRFDMSLEPAYADPKFLTDALGRRHHDLMLAPGARDALLQRLKQTTLVDPTPLLARIPVPTLLLWGESDAMIPFANSADYLRALPNATLGALPAVGHLPQEEAAARSLAMVIEFLKPLVLLPVSVPTPPPNR